YVVGDTLMAVPARFTMVMAPPLSHFDHNGHGPALVVGDLLDLAQGGGFLRQCFGGDLGGDAFQFAADFPQGPFEAVGELSLEVPVAGLGLAAELLPESLPKSRLRPLGARAAQG